MSGKIVQVRSRRPRNPRVSVIVPVRNEARNLERVLPELPDLHEVIVVDGNSQDGSIATAQRMLPAVKVIRQGRTGKGNALAHGFAEATGDIIVMFDADGSADPAEIGSFIAALMAGADFAKGSRFLGGGGSGDITFIRRLGNHVLNLSANLTFKQRYSDLCYGYNAFWTDILPVLDLPDADLPPRSDGRMRWGDGFEIEAMINCRVAAAGLRVTEVASVERQRIHGESNLRAVQDGLRVLRTIVRERHRARCEYAHRPDVSHTAPRGPISEPGLPLEASA